MQYNLDVIVSATFACLLLTPQISVPAPPYKRTGTLNVGEYVRNATIHGDLAMFAVADRIQAFNLRTHKLVWTYSLPDKGSGEGLSVVGNQLLVNASPAWSKPNGSFFALDLQGGKRVWSMPRTGEGSAIASQNKTVFTSLAPFSLSSINLPNRKINWTTKLSNRKAEGMREGSIGAVVCSPTLVVVNCDSTTYGLSATTGKVQWSVPQSYMFQTSFAVAAGVVLIPVNEGCVARDLSTGKELWKKEQVGPRDSPGAFAGQFVVLGGGKVTSIQPRSGQINWTHTVGPSGTSGGNQYLRNLGDRLFVRGISHAGIYDAKGKEIWRGVDDDAIASPLWTDGKNLMCFDGQRLLRYVHGSPDAVPKTEEGKAKLASEMVKRLDSLDPAEIKQLESLGDSAFDPVLTAFIKACQAYDAKSESAGMSLYDRYQTLARILNKVTSPKGVPSLIAAYKASKVGASERPFLLAQIGKHGSEEQAVPFFLDAMQEKVPSFEMYESATFVARGYISQSSHPDAVKFMIGKLKDPNADYPLRFEAYVNLARTGGSEGLRAVLEVRNKRRLLKPLVERLELDQATKERRAGVTTTILDEKTASGRTWGLLQSGILGSRGDLWIAEKINGQWKNPVFTGISASGVSRWAKPAPPEPKLGGKTAEELVKGAWLQVAVPNATLRIDQDGDGLTDVVEKRLGTDPKKSDTDGDGDPDEVDPWPNAAPRELSDAEQALAAIMEARYHFYDSDRPAIFFAPKGMKPFEMVAWPGPFLWQEQSETRWSNPLEQCYEQGVGFISFHGDQRQDDSQGTWEESVLVWNKERTEVRTTISTYYGGLSGDGYTAVARKIDGQWVVVAMQRAYVS